MSAEIKLIFENQNSSDVGARRIRYAVFVDGKYSADYSSLSVAVSAANEIDRAFDNSAFTKRVQEIVETLNKELKELQKELEKQFNDNDNPKQQTLEKPPGM